MDRVLAIRLAHGLEPAETAVRIGSEYGRRGRRPFILKVGTPASRRPIHPERISDGIMQGSRRCPRSLLDLLGALSLSKRHASTPRA